MFFLTCRPVAVGNSFVLARHTSSVDSSQEEKRIVDVVSQSWRTEHQAAAKNRVLRRIQHA